MFAIIETGGKQYKVFPGSKLRVEKLPAEVGEKVKFETVMMIVDDDKVTIGQPYVERVWVEADVIEHARADKVRIIKFKRRKHYMKRQGHRQDYTVINICEIKQKAQAAKQATVAKKVTTTKQAPVDKQTVTEKNVAVTEKVTAEKKTAVVKKKTTTEKKTETAKRKTAVKKTKETSQSV